MFALSDEDLTRSILGCGDGPASFNAEATEAGVEVVSVDPIYAFPAKEIQARVESVFDDMVNQTAANADDFVWGRGVDDLDDLVTKRRTAVMAFLDDYEVGLVAGRYRPGQLPELSFLSGFFDLALCSHFLFLYADQLSTQFHVDSIVELCRVAREVRVFPLQKLGSLPSRHLSSVQDQLDSLEIATRIETVSYEFQRGGNQLLVASNSSAAVRYQCRVDGASRRCPFPTARAEVPASGGCCHPSDLRVCTDRGRSDERGDVTANASGGGE